MLTLRTSSTLRRTRLFTLNTKQRISSMSTAKPIPILVTGAAETIGSAVVASMKPEYETIHFTLAASSVTEIPLLLKGEVPDPRSSSLGSGDWSTFPKAIVFGGAYEDAMIDAVRKAVAETSGTKRIPWLRVDSNRPHPPIGPEYAAAIVARTKAMLAKLESEGKFDAEDDSIYLF
ncbi:hypothetical protein C8R45DRAFT_1033485 [Mycena sanguinolenta]|nr:hypothetical protein C8R45DRAFT_1033485 [Mycena sanguinolenta]